MKRHEQFLDLCYSPAAMLASIYVNAHLDKNAQRVTPDDFIPSRIEARRRAEARMKQFRLEREAKGRK